MVVVDTIVQALTQEEAPIVTPNAVVNTLRPLLRASKSITTSVTLYNEYP